VGFFVLLTSTFLQKKHQGKLPLLYKLEVPQSGFQVVEKFMKLQLLYKQVSPYGGNFRGGH
jgi:hypothetical protein